MGTDIVVVLSFLTAVISGAALNIIAGKKIAGVSPVVVNASRTLLASAILAVVAVLWGVPLLSASGLTLWKYFVLAMLTMALPHSLIFIARQHFDVSATALALIEAAIVGVVLVYLLAGGKYVSPLAVALAVTTILGLTIFVNPKQLKRGDALILVAALVTAFGFIAAEHIKAPKIVAPLLVDVGAFTLDLPNLGESLRKTTLTTASSGGTVLLVVWLVNLACAALAKPKVPVAVGPLLANWGLLLSLAIAGSILTWFSLFVLIDLGHLFLAASAVAATPVATEVYSAIRRKSEINTVHQWLGGLVVMASLAGLIWVQLALPRPLSGPIAAPASGVPQPADSPRAKAS